MLLFTMAVFAADIDQVAGLANMTKSLGLIKAGAVAADAGIIIGSPLGFEGRPSVSMRRCLPEIISLSMACLAGFTADKARLTCRQRRGAGASFFHALIQFTDRPMVLCNRCHHRLIFGYV